jgi:hypothetical protein
MKPILCTLLVIPLLSFGQRYGGYVQAHLGFDLPKNVTFVYGAKLDGGVSINNTFFIGGGAGITKIDQIEGIYIPLYANFSVAIQPYSKFFPILILQPGYGIYKEDTKLLNTSTIQSSTGGFTYFAGIGVGISTQIKVKSCVSIGYSQYNFKAATGEIFNFKGPSIRITMLML